MSEFYIRFMAPFVPQTTAQRAISGLRSSGSNEGRESPRDAFILRRPLIPPRRARIPGHRVEEAPDPWGLQVLLSFRPALGPSRTRRIRRVALPEATCGRTISA
jgi:hypothetical protein